MHISYDPNDMERMATALYKRARGMDLSAGFLGLLLGAGAGAGFNETVMVYALNDWPLPTAGAAALCAGVGLYFGWAFTRPRSLALRLQAQSALCMLSVERAGRRTQTLVAASIEASAPASDPAVHLGAGPSLGNEPGL